MRKQNRFLSLGLVAAVILSMIGIGIPMLASAETNPMTWKPMDKGYVIIEMDDASEELETFYKIIVEEYGFPMCSSCWSVDLDTNTEKVARLRWLEDHGGEITSHTHDKLIVNGSTPDATIEADFKASYEAFKAHGFNVNGIMVQGTGGSELDYYSPEVRARVEPITSKYFAYSDRYGVSTQYDNKRNWLAAGWSQTKPLIDSAISNKFFTILATHGYDEVPGMATYTHEYLIQLLDYLKEKEDAGELEVITYRDLFKRFAEWGTPVDLGDTKYTVDFYSRDGKTLLKSQVVNEGSAATAPTPPALPGITYTGWDTDFSNVTDNLKVTATAQYADGTPLGKDDVINVTAYVDPTNGNDTTAKIGFETAPYATMSAAISALDALTSAEISARIVQLSAGTYTGDIAAHTHEITVRGAGTTTLLAPTGSYIKVFGPTVFENLKFTYSGEMGLYSQTNDITLGEGVSTPYTNLLIGVSGGGNTASTGVEDITVKSGKLFRVTFGSQGSTFSNKSDGINFVQTGGSAIALRLGANKITYNGDVNITLANGLSWHNDSGLFFYPDNVAFADGKALQVIYNNNSKNTNATKSGDNYPTAEKVGASNGLFYELVVDANDVGSTLSTTETAGTYKLNDAGPCTAVAYDANGTEKARSENGYLTVPAAGIYTVRWVLAGDVVAYVDAANGNDTTAKIGFETAPYATMSAAISALDALTSAEISARFVQLSAGTYTGDIAAHTHEITVRGVGTTTLLAPTVSKNYIQVNGPTVFENLKFNHSAELGLYSRTNDITLGEGVSSTTTNLLIGIPWTGNTASTGVEDITVKSGSLFKVTFGSQGSTFSNKSDGINFVQTGGTTIALRLGANKITYNGDVNITLANGLSYHTTSSGLFFYPDNVKFADGKALQVIYNNNSKNANATKSGDNYPTAEKVGASNGLFYELVVDANDVGSTLSTTETAGTYKLNDAGSYTAVAYDANGTEKARSENGYLTVPTAGAYTVRWEETPTCSATMTAHAAQIRGDGGLRFISTIDGINATRNADGTANYSAATIAVNGVTYKVTTVGTVFARKTKLGSAELVLGLSGVSYDIPAVKLQNPANAPTGITMKDGTILFTGVIVNIPQTSYSETLVARAYVAYDDGGVIKYVYADPIERSYQGILESLE